MLRLRYVFFALLGVIACAQIALAAGPYDPELTWRTIKTPRFAVHYHDGGRNLAIRAARIAEEVLDDVGTLFGYTPDHRIEIVLVDNSDLANGSAQVFPKNIVRLLLAAPTELTGLSSYDDWLRLLIIHELAHIVDIDQTFGFTRFLRAIFGKYIQMNGYTPQFLSEGSATYAETLLSQTGRGRSSYVAMLIRMAALDGTFIGIDQAHISYADWPRGNAAYFFGGRFHLWLADSFGWEKVRDLHNYYASMPLPYLYWFGARQVLGKSLPTLWDEWQQNETAFALEVQAQVQAAGETQSRRITSHGRNITGARYSPDGKHIIYSRTSPVDGSTVRRVGRDGEDDQHLVLQTFSPRFSFEPDGSGFYYSQAAINERFNNFNDLYRYDLNDDNVTRLRDIDSPERSLRARDPDVSRDGKHIVFVQNQLHQNKITIGTFDTENKSRVHLRDLVGFYGDRQHASPRFSPDGTKVAVSTWFEGGFRDIIIVDTANGALVKRVTADTALDGNPTWGPEGKYLLYESDIDGISNIYAYDLEADTYARVTRVVGGAFQPHVSPEGTHLLFRNASGIGFDIHEMPYRPESWEAFNYSGLEDPMPNAEPQEPLWGKSIPREDEPSLELSPTEEEEPYNLWRTILPFHNNWNLQPVIFASSQDVVLQASTIGQDVLAENTYVATVGTSAPLYRLNWAVSYINDMWYPTFAVSGVENSRSFVTGNGRVSERRRSGTFSFALPVKQRHLVSALYSFQRREGLTADAGDFLALGDVARVEVGYRYSFVQRFPYSVSPEYGKSFSVAARWYSSALGGDFDELLTTFDVRTFLHAPWSENHVLALRLVGAFAFGPDYRERFVLGGAQGNSSLSVQSENVYQLRGFPINFSLYPPGIGLTAAYAEYRFPVWQIEKGIWTWPIYFKRIHLAFFTEGGNTFGDGSEQRVGEVLGEIRRRLRNLRIGAGGELRLDAVLGWEVPLTTRLGIGLPIVTRGRFTPDGGINDAQFYFAFGTTL